MSNYSAAKEGVVGFTRSIARELGEFGVTANVLRPIAGNSTMAIPEVFATISYSMETLGIPYISNQWLSDGGVEGKPEHVAAVAAWLCTAATAPLTGREIYINGGQPSFVQGGGSVKRLVQAGANVTICDRIVELGADFAREIGAYFIALDVIDGAIRMAAR